MQAITCYTETPAAGPAFPYNKLLGKGLSPVASPDS
jgi:hypothetical protein